MITDDETWPPRPVGAVGNTEWDIDDPLPSRVVYGHERALDGHRLTVQTSAIQYQDGRIDVEGEPPVISVQVFDDHGLTPSQARAAAQLLANAADQLDRWLRG
ncbi:hypothetical protein ACXPWS_16445 [Mycobacterium sp. BMJ-28]